MFRNSEISISKRNRISRCNDGRSCVRLRRHRRAVEIDRRRIWSFGGRVKWDTLASLTSLSFNTLMSANVTTSLCLPPIRRCKGVFTTARILLEDEALFSRWYLRLPIPPDPSPNFYIVFAKVRTLSLIDPSSSFDSGFACIFFFFCKGKIIVEFRANIIKKMKQRSEAGWSSLIRTKFFQIVEYFHYSIRFDDRKQSMEWLVFVNFGTVWRGDGRSKRWSKSRIGFSVSIVETNMRARSKVCLIAELPSIRDCHPGYEQL